MNRKKFINKYTYIMYSCFVFYDNKEEKRSCLEISFLLLLFLQIIKEIYLKYNNYYYNFNIIYNNSINYNIETSLI